MKRTQWAILLLLTIGQLADLSAQTAAPGSTRTRDVWGDTWMPEWNTFGAVAGYRNTTRDPKPAAWSAEGKTLTAVKSIDGMGEGRWDHSALLVFAEDGNGQWVRFGMWTSARTRSTQTITFTIPDWAKGEIKWEYWSLYGAVSDITNFQYDPATSTWVNKQARSHQSIGSGTTGIVVETIRPKALNLFADPSTPIADLSASSPELNLGDAINFTLTSARGDNEAATLVGKDVSITNPSSSVSVTPTLPGIQNYTFTLPGVIQLSWETPETGSIVTLTTPTGDDVVVTSNSEFVASIAKGGEGTYSIIQTNSRGISSLPTSVNAVFGPPAIASASINVLLSAATVTVIPEAASYTVSNGIANGRTYPRSWNDGSQWRAYLGRDGVKIKVTGTSTDAGIANFHLQAKTPAGDWTDLAPVQSVDSSVANGAGISVSQSFSVRLGAVLPEKPLIPADVTLAGTWQLRARVQTSAGNWSGWSTYQPLLAEMPLATVTKTGQTLPPIEDAAWYTASEVKTYVFKVWIP